jgi:hypothetical protein
MVYLRHFCFRHLVHHVTRSSFILLLHWLVKLSAILVKLTDVKVIRSELLRDQLLILFHFSLLSLQLRPAHSLLCTLTILGISNDAAPWFPESFLSRPGLVGFHSLLLGGYFQFKLLHL